MNTPTDISRMIFQTGGNEALYVWKIKHILTFTAIITLICLVDNPEFLKDLLCNKLGFPDWLGAVLNFIWNVCLLCQGTWSFLACHVKK